MISTVNHMKTRNLNVQYPDKYEGLDEEGDFEKFALPQEQEDTNDLSKDEYDARDEEEGDEHLRN